MNPRTVSLIVAAFIAVALVAAISGVASAQLARPSVPASERTFYVTGLEYKGSTSTKDLAAPTVDPKTLSDGYRYKKPGEADSADATKWEVSTYRWEPGFMQVLLGDKVDLVGFIVNGDKHTVWVEDPSGQNVTGEQLWNRGREYRVSFVAEKLGYYQLHCDEHDPTMTAYILVLPR